VEKQAEDCVCMGQALQKKKKKSSYGWKNNQQQSGTVGVYV